MAPFPEQQEPSIRKVRNPLRELTLFLRILKRIGQDKWICDCGEGGQ